MKFKGTFGAEFSGSAGALTASHNRGGYYLRQRVIPVNPNSDAQRALRTTFSAAVVAYSGLSAVNRDGWKVWADNTPFTDSLGDPRPVTGQNAFIGSYTLKTQAGLAPVTAAPSTFNRGALGDVSLGSVMSGAGTYDITFDPTAEWATAVGGALLIFQGRPQNASVSFYKGPFLFAAAVPGAAVAPTSPETVPTLYPLATGQRVFVRLVAVMPDGRYTTGVILNELAS